MPYETHAEQALAAYPHLQAQGFEASKVFALIAMHLESPPPGFPSHKYLVRHLAPLYLFVVHQTRRHQRGNKRVLIHPYPETWYLRIAHDSVRVGRGRPRAATNGTFRRRRIRPIVIECLSLIHI
mgnify:FL=1